MVTTLPEQIDHSPVDGPGSRGGDRRTSGRAVAKARRPLAILLMLFTAGAALLLLAGWTLVSLGSGTNSDLIFYRVKMSDLPIQVTENGSLQSQKTTELRCEVENFGRERSGTQILTIVPNGEYVKEGDLLVELDSALIRNIVAAVRREFPGMAKPDDIFAYLVVLSLYTTYPCR